jgi:DNA repair protein SbcD/Mre11
MRILVTGDLHLGKRAARLPRELAADPRFSAASVWEAIVERAVHLGVDLVALTGDVVDRENRFFEALDPLERGLKRLADAGIPTFAVAGNHDATALPRLADQLPAGTLRLLGRGGRWERAAIERDGRLVLFLDGWSFPRERNPEDPMLGYQPPAPSATPVLGLLHTDLDVLGSPYAPTASSRLRATQATAWLLGHIHAPRYVPGPGPALLYPGSPLAFDSGETGAHGPWVVELQGPKLVRCEQLPLSPTRFEAVDLDLDGVDSLEEVDARLSRTLRSALAQADDATGGTLGALGLRVVARGRTGLKARLAPRLESARESLQLRRGEALGFLEGWLDQTRRPIDLVALAASDHPAGALARLLAALEAGETLPELERIVARLAEIHGATAYQQLAGDAPPDADAARELARQAAERLLERLLEQKEGVA